MTKDQLIDVIKSGKEVVVSDLLNYGYSFRQNKSNEEMCDVHAVRLAFCKVHELDFILNIDYYDDDEVNGMLINRKTKEEIAPQIKGGGCMRTVYKKDLIDVIQQQ